MFPDNHAVLVMGEASTGLFEFCCYLGSTYLKNGDKVVFLENNTSPRQVRRQMSKFGVEASEYEETNHLVIVDASMVSTEQDESAIRVENPSVLPYIFEGVTQGIEKAGGKPARVIFDSLTSLYMHQDPETVGRFFKDLSTMSRCNGTMTCVIHKGILDEDQIAMVAGLADGILEMKIDGKYKRFIRINYLKGTAVTPKWVPFEFDTGDQEEEGAFLGWGGKEE